VSERTEFYLFRTIHEVHNINYSRVTYRQTDYMPQDASQCSLMYIMHTCWDNWCVQRKADYDWTKVCTMLNSEGKIRREGHVKLGWVE
jgi:hypothetical protein